MNLLADLKYASVIGQAIAQDVEAFASGSTLTTPLVDVPVGNTGNEVEVQLTAQKATGNDQPFKLAGFLGLFFLALTADRAAGMAIPLPPWTEKFGNTWLLLGGTVAIKHEA